MSVSRRHFFYGTLLAGAVPTAGFGSSASLKHMGYQSPNEKLNIAAIGAGGKGRSDITGCATENIVAMADPDALQARQMFTTHEKAAKYTDFRKMLDKEERNIDAVIVSTPDFMHAAASLAAMEHGKHVYCQKPLTRTIWEARALTAAAAKYNVATQMGNQGYSNEGSRQCAEMIWSGAIGNVTEVHAWTNRPIWPQGLTALPAPEKVPDTMEWDTWLGVANERPYSKEYAPFKWRGWFDFGCGALGDMACHILGAPNMALMLGAPTSVECIMQEGKSEFTFPKKSIIRFDFPARGAMPPVKIFWYDGMVAPPPRPSGIPDTELLGDLPRATGSQPHQGQPIGEVFDPSKPIATTAPAPRPNGSLFVGDKGFLTTGTYGENTRLVPVERMNDFKLPPALLTRSPGHYRDWIRAAKGGDPACSNFSIAGPFTEWILLGVIALRTEGKIEWDSAKMKITNNSEANKLVKPFIRKGWKIG